MPFQKNDILLAFKAIALSEQLNGTDKQIAVALIDSYNRKTGRCDPSEETLAIWTGKSVRTVKRAIKRIVVLKLFGIRRHGGHNHCNSYEPKWEYYRLLEQNYKRRRREHAKRFVQQNVSPSECQTCHSSDDNIGTQTYPNNNIPLSYPYCTPNSEVSRSTKEGLGSGNTAASYCSGRMPKSQLLDLSNAKDVREISAERRWNNDLLKRFRLTPMYATIVEALDPKLQGAATEAEAKRTGTGLRCIVEELIRRQVLSPAQN